MSQITKEEVLEKKRGRYCRAGQEHKSKIIDELVELFGYHRKAAIRALRRKRGIEVLEHGRWFGHGRVGVFLHRRLHALAASAGAGRQPVRTGAALDRR